jgi:hypothetical protein
MKKTLIILALVTLIGCSKDEGYTMKKYHYKVWAGGFNCDAILTHDGISEDMNAKGTIEFDSRRSFEVKFTPNPASRYYRYNLYVERENTWHQEENHDSYINGFHSEKTYIVK